MRNFHLYQGSLSGLYLGVQRFNTKAEALAWAAMQWPGVQVVATTAGSPQARAQAGVLRKAKQ